MPANARFSTAAARGYKPLNAAPYNVRIVESTVTENGTVNVTWRNNALNRSVYAQYSINFGSWLNWGIIGNSSTATSASINFGANQPNIRVRLQYLLPGSIFSNVSNTSNTITTRPTPPFFYAASAYLPGVIKGSLGNNGFVQVGVDPNTGGQANITATITRDGVTIATGVTSPAQYNTTANGVTVTWTARNYNSTTGLFSTLLTQPTYSNGTYNASTNFGVSGAILNTRNFSVFYNGNASTYTIDGNINFLVSYTGTRYCDSIGQFISIASGTFTVGPYSSAVNTTTGYITRPFFLYQESGAPYTAIEYYTAYVVDTNANHLSNASTHYSDINFGFSYDPC